MSQDMVLVLNFSDSASREAARKLRAERICCRIVPGTASLEDIRKIGPRGIILAADADEREDVLPDTRILQGEVPMLALGYAACEMMRMAGGTVGEIVLENRLVPLRFSENILTDGVADQERMLRRVRDLQPGGCMTVLCESGGIVIGYRHDVLPLYGIQLEMEQNDPDGAQILRNFACEVCGCTGWWDDEAYVSAQVDAISGQAGDGKVMCAVTGGLDSAVTAALAYRAVGRRLRCVLIDTGLMHEGECSRFMRVFADEMGMDITLVNAQERFLEALRGITDQSRKRSLIGGLLRDILMEEMRKIPDLTLLIRGTNCSDVMQRSFEELPDDIPVKTFEPIRDLFKDEIRRVAGYLGFPNSFVTAQPFPGTGMALRIRGEVTEERLSTVRAADRIFNEELQQAGVKRLMKSFAVLETLPESRGNVICLRAVQAAESLSATAARLPYDMLENTVKRILNEVPGVIRVFYDLTGASTYSRIEYREF